MRNSVVANKVLFFFPHKLKMLNKIETKIRNKFVYNGFVISYPKCGRTWINSLLLHYVLRHYDQITEPLPFQWAPPIIRHTWYRRFPNICFTHDISSPARPYYQYNQDFDVSPYITKRCVLLVRDPRDVVVSYYYHARKKTHKNKLPADISLNDFCHHDSFGLRPVITFFNIWVPFIQCYPTVTYFRYEDLKANTKAVMEQMLSFFGVTKVDSEALDWAITQTKFERLQEREVYRKSSEGEDTKQDDLRVRRGKVGGFQDEIDAEEIQYVNEGLNGHLDSIYGYS